MSISIVPITNVTGSDDPAYQISVGETNAGFQKITQSAAGLLGKSASGDTVIITAGTNLTLSGTTLDASGGGGGTSNHAGARVYNNANISVAHNTAQALTFNSERYDNGACHNTGSNTGRLTCTTAGLYSIGACIEMAGNNAGNYRIAIIKLNGTTDIARDAKFPAAGVDILTPHCVYYLALTDYVEVYVFQDSGAGLNALVQANYSPEFWFQLLDAY